jgi:hypothetical protein
MKRDVLDPLIFTVVAQAPPARSLGVTPRTLIRLAFILSLAGCTSAPAVKPEITPEHSAAFLVCDSYIIFDMCVRDLAGDGAVDMIYFSDTNEIFMYREGMRNTVAEVMPLHRCAVPLDEGMQKTTDRILHRKNIQLSEEVVIVKELIVNYAAAKTEIDACNAYFDELDGVNQPPEEEFFMGEWDDQ